MIYRQYDHMRTRKDTEHYNVTEFQHSDKIAFAAHEFQDRRNRIYTVRRWFDKQHIIQPLNLISGQRQSHADHIERYDTERHIRY